MKILVGCEESQAVCIEFRKRGHEAYSCDLQECSGGHPEWHIISDVLLLLDGGYFKTQSGDNIFIDKWDMGIFFTPCTYSCNSGIRWMYKHNKYALDWDGKIIINQQRMENCKKYAKLLQSCLNSNIPLICCENPIPHHFAVEFIGRKYDQLIQPYQFGHGETKATCLWLKRLPFLQYTSIVKERKAIIHRMAPGKYRAKLRSKTYLGIAKAMAEQWGVNI